MGVLGWIIGAGVVGGLIHKSNKKAREKAEEEERRRNTPCYFLDGFSESDFELMANRAAKRIKRLSVSIEGPIIYGTVQSQSGISEWCFKADFNNYGHITGDYWISSDNTDSDIPNNYADKVASFIRNYNSDDYDYEEFEERSSSGPSQTSQFSGSFCPFCGKRITATNSTFCSYCGKRLI